MARQGVPELKFKGFMVDSAQTKWNAVRVIYGSDDATISIKDQERTCLFHWAQSLEKHTKADIRADLQHQHRQLYRQEYNFSFRIRNSIPCHSSMVALLQGHDRAGTESTRTLAGILALPLLPMEWIHVVGKFAVVHQFAYDTVYSTGICGSSFLHLILICVSAICRISPNQSL
jgi:hypothetical protein